MQESNVQKLWKGTKILNKLKILNLSYSKCLVKTPNFRGLPSLERLILVDCTSLVEVHKSIGNLKSLVLFNLKDCNSLKTLPESMGSLKSLQTLNVTECSQLEKLPDSLGGLESLIELLAKGTAIKQLPTFGGNNYSLKSCSSSIATRPASFTSFSSLKNLDLSYTGLADAISSIDFGSLSSLEYLDLSGNGFFNLPSSISRLPKLHDFTVARCKNLLSISELPSSVRILSISGCTSIERVSAPHHHERMVYLNVIGCRNLIEIQGMEFVDNYWSCFCSDDFNNLSENCKMSLIQGFCKGTRYTINLAGGEIPEWFDHRGEGAALSFHLPSVSVPDGNKLQALLFWLVLATPESSSLPFNCGCAATIKNKRNGIILFGVPMEVAFDRNSTKHSWIQRYPLIGLEETLQGVEELELNVDVRSLDDLECWVEKCGVHLIMEKSKADSDIHGEKWDHEIDIHALGSSTTDDQRLASSLIRELPELKISMLRNYPTFFQLQLHGIREFVF